MTRGGRVRLALVALLLSACAGGTLGPWLDADGNPVQNSQIVQFQGIHDCDRRLMFIRFFGRQYVQDPTGVLGTLRSPTTGDPLTYAVLDEVPPGVEPSGFHHRSREIYIDRDDFEDYIYVVTDLSYGQVVQRWPRVDDPCPGEGR